jgi:O-antigen/teichoic acid export membrane protein
MFRNASWMLAGQSLSYLLQATYFVLIGRLLGSQEYGVYVGAVALVSIVSQYSPLGSGMLFIRHVSQDERSARVYFGNILLSVIGMSGLLILGLALAGPHLLSASSAALVVIVGFADCLFNKLIESLGQVFQALEKLRWTATLNFIANLSRVLAALVLFVALPKTTAHTWAVVSLVLSCLCAVFAVRAVFQAVGAPTFSLSLFRRRFSEGILLSFSGSTTVLYNDLDKTMLSHMGFDRANGIYTMAYRAIDVATTPIRSIHSAALPRFCKAGDKSLSTGLELAKKILSRTSVMSGLIAVVLFCSAPLIPYILGRDFAESASALRWLCLIPLFRSFQLSAGDALTGAGYQGYRMSAQLIAAAFNFGVNLWLIPHYGWRGAAWSSLATDAALGVLCWLTLGYLRASYLRISSYVSSSATV